MAQFKQGMNPEVISSSGDKLIQYKGEIDSIVSSVDTAVNSLKSNWGGQDSEQFQSDWNKKKQTVSKCGEDLNAMGKKCKTNAESQKTTSQA